MLVLKYWILHILAMSGHCLQCLDSNGVAIDWYFVYKLPKLIKHPDDRFKTGRVFYYLDNNVSNWTISPTLIDENDTAISKTLSQIYDNKDELMYMLYNDLSPHTDASRTKKGHTKGVVAFDSRSGFWMIHSAPRYPPRLSQGYSWIPSASFNGQNFLCVTFDLHQLDIIGHQLLYNQPHVYDYQLPQDFVTTFPVLKTIINGSPPHGPPWYNVTKVTSLQGQVFTSFAKANNFGADLYDSLVSPSLKQNLQVETWMNGPGDRLPSNCSSTYQVYNVDAISFGQDLTFDEKIDHSKWAITSTKQSDLLFTSEIMTADNWVCASDINRKTTQFKRGGGCLCLQHAATWKSFSSIISHYQAC